MGGVQLPQGLSHFEEAVSFLPLSSQKFLVLILSTLEPPSGFDTRPLDWESSDLTTRPLLLKENLLAYLHSYLSNRKQCLRINVTSDFETIISGVPQGSTVSPILFIFFNGFFYFIEKASVHNFADDNTLSMFEETIQNCTFRN